MKGGKTKGPEKPIAPYMRYSRKVTTRIETFRRRMFAKLKLVVLKIKGLGRRKSVTPRS